MFEARKVALEVAEEIREPMELIRAGKAGLGDQIERAVMSMVLNIGEASRRTGRDRTNRWRYASGSAAETRDALELAIAWRLVPRDAVLPSLERIDRILAMLWRLEHPRRR